MWESLWYTDIHWNPEVVFDILYWPLEVAKMAAILIYHSSHMVIHQSIHCWNVQCNLDMIQENNIEHTTVVSYVGVIIIYIHFTPGVICSYITLTPQAGKMNSIIMQVL